MNRNRWLREAPLYLMLLPPVALVLVFSYGPMVGIIMAFQKFLPQKGFFASPLVGLKNFEYMFNMPDVYQVWWNTIFIAIMKIIAGLIVPVFFALLLNEIRNKAYKRTIQTVIYLPYFLSWVMLAGIMVDILSPSYGIVNQFLGLLGIKPIFFLGNAAVFPYTMVATDVWKSFGFGTIVYLAALTSISPELYESAIVDGANRWRQTIHITLPGMLPIITLMTVLSLGSILDAGFDQIFNLYSPQVYETGDIIDTVVYRMGILDRQYGVSTAMGLFKSVIAAAMILLSNYLANRVANYRIF